MIIKDIYKYRAMVVVLLLAFAGCRATKNAGTPELLKMPQAFADSARVPVPLLNWKDVFKDAGLQSLIDTALHHNYDLKTGVQRILIAGANMKMAKMALLPTLNANISAGVDQFGKYTMNGVGNFDTNFSTNINRDQQIPNPTPDYFMGFRSSWEIDIWGKLSNRKKAAWSRYLASQKGQQWYHTQLVTQVATLYFELVALDKQAEILSRNIVLQQKGVEIIEAQLVGGRATALAVKQFRAQMLSTKGKQFEIRQAIARTENELNTLLGRYPEKITRDTSAITRVLPEKIYAGIPAEVILRRPDIQEAELELAAAKADVNAARKALLPSLNLDAYSGFNSFRLPLLFSPGSLASGVLAGITGPVFNRGALKNGKEIADAVQLTAFYNYQKSIIQGYQEVSTQMNAIDNYKAAEALKSREVRELKEALSTANDLYLAGYASYLEVIVAQATVLNAEIEQVNLKQQSYTALINLFRALGG